MFTTKFSKRTKILGGLTLTSAAGLVAAIALEPKELAAISESVELIADSIEEISEVAEAGIEAIEI